MDKKLTAWDLFFECFKEGEEVVVVDDDERLWFGKLQLHPGPMLDNSFSLINFRGKEKRFEWEEISFMAHDGFPIKKLTGADGSRAIEAMDTTDITKAVRALATKTLCDMCCQLKESSGIRTSRKKRKIDGELRYVKYCKKCGEKIEHHKNSKEWWFLFGDPFLIENVSAELYNPGNSSPEFWGHHDYEEVLILTAKDGAKAQLFTVPNIYYFGD